MAHQPVLYLIPTSISPVEVPAEIIRAVLPDIDFFICERIRTTRRWLRLADSGYNIDSRPFYEFDKHRETFPLADIRKQWEAGKKAGLTSEAGTPAVADPGFRVVAEAHRLGIPVKPLPGNNSLILALMASGLNGNQFTYHGYFPLGTAELKKKFNHIRQSIEAGYTQIFIETPYRNQKTLSDLLKILPDHYRLSVSSGLLTSEEQVRTLTAEDWRSVKTEYLNKIPAVFCIGL